MTNSIPARYIVSVNPNVLAAGGSGLDLIGLILSNGTRIPANEVVMFGGPEEVAEYFGPTAKETSMAVDYFAGFTNSDIKPGGLLFYGWPVNARAGWLRGASMADVSLDTLKTFSGIITLTVGGVEVTSEAINLAAATSYSNAATLIAAGFTTPPFTVTYDAIGACFIFEATATGDAATITFGSGTLADDLRLGELDGASLSQGSAAVAPSQVMADVTAATQNFSTFTTSFIVTNDQGLALAEWNNAQNNRYLFAVLDTNIAATTQTPDSALGYQIVEAGYSGTAPIYAAQDRNQAAFMLAYPASLDFQRANGDMNAAFRTRTGIVPDVTSATVATQLERNGYNYIGAWGTANDEFRFLYPATVSGPFEWIDAYVNQIWLNNELQLALMVFLTSMRSVPYNEEGKAMIEAAMMGVINQALNFGAIRAGIELSPDQRAQINSQAGLDIADTIVDRGWYILVGNASPATRAQRNSPPITLWYTEGGSVQRINVQSVEVQ